MRLAGVSWVSINASRADWTCAIRTTGGRLPRLEQMAEQIAGMGQGARLRGVEITGDGTLEKAPGGWRLRLSLTGERVDLAPLTRKVQWDIPSKRPQEPREAERSAFAVLIRQAAPGSRVRLVGPLSDSEAGWVLEVRRFQRLPGVSRRRSASTRAGSKTPR